MTITDDDLIVPERKLCQVTDAGGACARTATVLIMNRDLGEPGMQKMGILACPAHTDHGFQEAGARGSTREPQFIVIPLGSLAQRIKELVPPEPLFII